MKRVEIDTEKALDLWTKGWCWNALGEHIFKCSGGTIKNRLRPLIDKEHRLFHLKNHGKNCPLCRGHLPIKDQLSLL